VWPLSRTRLARAQLPLRMLGAIFGILLFLHLIHRAGPTKLLASMVALRLGVGVSSRLGWGRPHLKTWAWAALPTRWEVSGIDPRMLGCAVSPSEAVGQFGASHSCSAKVCACRAGPDNSALAWYCVSDD